MKKDRHGHQVFDATIQEMGAKLSDDLVKIDPKVIEAVAADDPAPMFVTINVAVEGVSKNGRIYSKDTIQSICDQINAGLPDGNPGHIPEKDRAHSRPDPTTIWLGAAVVEKDGKAHVYAKGYVMPEEAKLRSYIKRCHAIGKNVAVSIYGKAKNAVYVSKEKAYRLEGFVLESVDWARSKSEGIPNDGTLILAAEMVGSNDPKEDDVERKDVIKSLKVDEVKEHNPGLVSEIQDDVNGEQAQVVTEMEEVKELTGDKPAEAIAEMQQENRRLKLDKEVGKIKAPAARPLIRGLVVSEMEKAEQAGEPVDVAEMVDGVLRSEEGKVIIEQHIDRVPKISPVGNQPEARAKRKHTNLTKPQGGTTNG